MKHNLYFVYREMISLYQNSDRWQFIKSAIPLNINVCRIEMHFDLLSCNNLNERGARDIFMNKQDEKRPRKNKEKHAILLTLRTMSRAFNSFSRCSNDWSMQACGWQGAWRNKPVAWDDTIAKGQPEVHLACFRPVPSGLGFTFLSRRRTWKLWLMTWYHDTHGRIDSRDDTLSPFSALISIFSPTHKHLLSNFFRQQQEISVKSFSLGKASFLDFPYMSLSTMAC